MCKVLSYVNGKAQLDKTYEKARKGIYENHIQISGDFDYDSNMQRVYTKTYTGKNITPKVVVTVDGLKLRNGVDYTVKYTNNKNIGNGKITITGINAYSCFPLYHPFKFTIHLIFCQSIKSSCWFI